MEMGRGKRNWVTMNYTPFLHCTICGFPSFPYQTNLTPPSTIKSVNFVKLQTVYINTLGS